MERIDSISKERRMDKTLRLTFQVANGVIRLVSHERLNMICPPSIGEPPKAGQNGGFWIELRDARDHLLFHRVLNNPLGDSIEVYSPDGKIQRVFGDVKENVFDVLLPDEDKAKTIVFIGESLNPVTLRKEQAAPTRELARFNVPKGMKSRPETQEGHH